jgi:hypothetical protein
MLSPWPAKEDKLKGKVTKVASKVLRVDPKKLKGIKGAHGEHRKPGDKKFDKMLAEDKKHGFEIKRPIGIGVDKHGKPYIENGNTHAAVARKLGVKKVPVEVRYYGGSEKKHKFNVKGYAEGGAVDPVDDGDDSTTDLSGVTVTAPRKPTDVELAVQKLTGMKPGLHRGSILPFYTDAQDNPHLGAPQFVYDLAKAFVTPGVAAQGGKYGMGDVLNMAANVTGGGVGASNVAGPTVSAGERVLGMGVAPKAPVKAAGEALGAKYGLPEYTTDLTPAQIEANRSAFLADSKAPPVLYHGTRQWTGTAYDPNHPTVNRVGSNVAGFYADVRPQRAEGYTVDWRDNTNAPAEGSQMLPVHVAIKNPFVPGRTEVTAPMLEQYKAELRASNPHMSRSGASDWINNKAAEFEQSRLPSISALNGDGMAYQRVLRAGGHDGMKDGTAWIAFEPTQIKSQFNRGTFDPNEPDMLKARGGLIAKYGV